MGMPGKDIAELCKEYSDLTTEDIKIVEKIAEHLQIIADLTQADIFIDCVTQNPNVAIVVAEAKPRTAKSLYRFPVIGQLALRKKEPAVIRTMQTGFFTIGMRGISQEEIPMKQSVVPIKNNKDRTIAVLIMEQDITEQVSREKKVKDLTETAEQLSKTLLRVAFAKAEASNILPDGFLILDEDGMITYYNIAARDLFDRIGFRNRTIKRKSIAELLPDLDFGRDTLTEQMYIESKIGGLNLAFTLVPMNNFEETASGAFMLIRDITEIRVKEKELMLQSVVIKEINHRIKNNLQTIASLLRLQARRADSRQTKKALYDSISRILSIAVVHEALSKESKEMVDIRIVLNYLVEVFKNISKDGKTIKINLKCDSIMLFSRQATSLVLVVNELVQNALEHAFVDRNDGLIDIEVRRINNNVVLKVSDNGIGFKKEKLKSSKSLGIKIVKTLVEEDLKGIIKFTNNKGTKVYVRFPFFMLEEVCYEDISS